MHKRLNSHFQAEGGSSAEEDFSMQCKSANPIRLDHRMHNKCNHPKLLFSLHHRIPVEEREMPNAIIAVGMDAFSGNVHLHHVPVNRVEGRIVVDVILEDAEEDEEVVVQDHRSQWEPL